MGRFKIWEVLLFIAVVLLGAIAYESHKANKQSRGRYINLNPNTGVWIIDTQTGATWEYFDSLGWTIEYPPIPQ